MALKINLAPSKSKKFFLSYTILCAITYKIFDSSERSFGVGVKISTKVASFITLYSINETILGVLRWVVLHAYDGPSPR